MKDLELNAIPVDDKAEQACNGDVSTSQPNPNTSTPNNGHALAFLSKVRYNSEYRMRCLHTVSVVWMFITLGLSMSLVGVTFPDIRLIIHKDLDTASWIFTTGAIGFMVGALVVGVLFDRLNRMLVTACVAVLNGICFAVYPWCSTFPAMLAISFVSNVFSGGVNCCGNAHVSSIWGGASAPFMQIVHLGFSTGGIIGPHISEPFIASKTCVPQNATTNTTPANSSSECVDVYSETHVQYAFLITGCSCFSAALPFIILYCLPSRYNAYVCSPLEEDGGAQESKASETKLPVLSFAKKIMFVSLVTLLISNVGTLEARFTTLLTTFLPEYSNWSNSVSLHVTSVFWGTIAAGRLFGIAVTRYVKAETMIIMYLLALAASFVGFLLAAEFAIRELIWACTALAGLSMSVIFPSVFTWTAESILRVTGTISSVYLIGVSVFNMVLPLLYGYLMDNFTQLYFAYLLIAETVLTISIYIITRCLLQINH